MDVFARWGWDVWTMDHEGYGRSGRTDGNSDIASGAADLLAAAAAVEREAGARSFHLLGESSGALRAAPSARRASRRGTRSGPGGWCWSPSPGPAAARPRSNSGRATWSTSAPTTAARAAAT